MLDVQERFLLETLALLDGPGQGVTIQRRGSGSMAFCSSWTSNQNDITLCERSILCSSRIPILKFDQTRSITFPNRHVTHPLPASQHGSTGGLNRLRLCPATLDDKTAGCNDHIKASIPTAR
jgi:hypothetical protein